MNKYNKRFYTREITYCWQLTLTPRLADIEDFTFVLSNRVCCNPNFTKVFTQPLEGPLGIGAPSKGANGVQ